MEEYRSRIPATVALKEDDEEKNIFIRELEEAVYKYIKTGVKSKQLDKVVDVEEKFQKGYKGCFNIEQFMQDITSESKSEVLKNIQEIADFGKSEEPSDVGKVTNIVDVALKKIEILLNGELDKILSEIAYLSHINMLYEMYEKENKLRQEEEEYKKMLACYKPMEEIVKQLRESRRMEARKLQESVKAPVEVIYAAISENPKYFNVKERGETYQISLSPTGKRISRQVEDATKVYSQEALDRLMYKNCYGVMEGLEKTFRNKSGRIIEGNIRFEGVSPENERTLQSKYRQVARKVLENEEELYCVWKNEERYGGYIEKNEYKIRMSGYDRNNGTVQ